MSKKNKNNSIIIVLFACNLVLVFVFVIAFFASHSSANRIEGMPMNTPLATPTDLPKDTTAPVVTARRVIIRMGENIEASAFIEQIVDESQCVSSYAEQPDLTRYGVQTVQVLVTDEKGNSTTVDAELNILNLKKNVTIHLGSTMPAATEFCEEAGSRIEYVTDITAIDFSQRGEYPIELLVDGDLGTATLIVQDLVAPEVIVKAKETWLNKPLQPEDFVKEVKDESAVSLHFVEEPKWDQEGEQKVTIIAYDSDSNDTVVETTLTVKRDMKAPTLTVTDIDVEVGGTVAYKKAISYYDDIDEKSEMKVSIERSAVDLNTIGTYEVTYSVTDCSGNTTTVIGKVNVLAESPKWADEDAIHAKADSILANILTDSMTEREKAKAIYRWLKNNIGYISHSEKGNYMRGAYEGLFEHQGDCFVYAASAKELLTRAGIQNIDIVKATTNPSHYWNLVYMEDGWYHFDTTPRKDKSEFFLLTDAELEAYSSTHKNSHNFDRSLYPEIK